MCPNNFTWIENNKKNEIYSYLVYFPTLDSEKHSNLKRTIKSNE